MSKPNNTSAGSQSTAIPMSDWFDHHKPPYPHRLVDTSAKYCLVCGAKQKRSIRMIGPMDEATCVGFRLKKPRNSHWLFWKCIGFGWLVSPPSPAEPGGWYVVYETGTCDSCGETHPEKMVRRKFGRTGLWSFKFKVKFRPKLYSLKPFDPRKPVIVWT